MQTITNFWAKMFNYKNKTNRKDFWAESLAWGAITFVVYYALSFLLGVASGVAGADEAPFIGISVFLLIIFGLIYGLALLSASVRRLRDGGFSPWLVILGFVPVGNIALFVLLLLPPKSKAGVNQEV